MSCDPEAKLFFGYVWPEKHWDDESDTPDQPFPEGPDAYDLETDEVTVGIHGYEGNLRNFVAVKASMVEVEWADFEPVPRRDESIEDDWRDMLAEFVENTGANIDGAHGPGWFLVSLYF